MNVLTPALLLLVEVRSHVAGPATAGGHNVGPLEGGSLEVLGLDRRGLGLVAHVAGAAAARGSKSGHFG